MACCFPVTPAFADAGWFESGDTQLRMDLQLLNDAEIIRLPLSYWPIPRAAVQYALANGKEHLAMSPAVQAALARVRARAGVDDKPASRSSVDAQLFGGHAGLWRDFDTLAREDGEMHLGADYVGERFSAGADLTWVADPADGDELRGDGSHATVALGNWLLSANLLDRWWGPTHDSSLILSNNARPMPTLMLERATAMAPGPKWLKWIGPWRMSFGLSQMENSRQDIDSPLFMAWRITIMPLKDLEIGFSRTAQFCGKQLECNWSVFGNLLVGNDNVGIDATPENEPGNQMAGFDIRWNSPIGDLPYAIYSQYIGEDESSYVPVKNLSLLGFEVWKPFLDGRLLQFHAEYANTICSGLWTARGPYYDCAYVQGRFNVEGYRYRGRVIGYTTDSDAESISVGASYESGTHGFWTLTGHLSRLNLDGPDARNTVAPVPTHYGALELGWRGQLWGEPISVDLGAQATQPENGDKDFEAYGFIGWRHEFRP